jgi:hypothetical protein
MVTMLTLKDGYQVTETALNPTIKNIRALYQKNYLVFFDLVEKCRNTEYQFISTPYGDSKAVLKTYTLMNEREEVPEYIQKIVLNSINGSGLYITLVNPIALDRVSTVNST